MLLKMEMGYAILNSNNKEIYEKNIISELSSGS